jgi:hypothetical protein
MDTRAKAILLTKAEADYIRMLVKGDGFGGDIPNLRAGILRKLAGLTEMEKVSTAGLYGDLKER